MKCVYDFMKVSLPQQATKLIDIAGELQLQFYGGFTATFTIGLDLSTTESPRFYIHGSSGLSLNAAVRIQSIILNIT